MADEKKEKKYTPIQPYDRTLFEDHSMYNNPHYTRDLSLFDNNEVMMNRGNMIHNYQTKMVEPRKVGGDVIDVEASAEYDVTDEAGFRSAPIDDSIDSDMTASSEFSEMDDWNQENDSFADGYDESDDMLSDQ